MLNKQRFWKNEKVKFAGFCIFCAFFVFIFYQLRGKKDEKGNGEEKFEEDNAILTNEYDGNCPMPVLAGDGVCDDELNIPTCDFDFGDCCNSQSDLHICEECLCQTSVSYLNSPCDIREHCSAPSHYLGDGHCHLEYNNENCYFDLGDCCYDDMGHCIKSTMYCIKDFMADGLCHEFNNGPMCNFDGGDCCDIRNTNQTFCCYCNSSHCPIQMIYPESF